MSNKKKEPKEIREYKAQKKKAKERNDFLEAAKICNQLGELYSEHGDYRNAITEHEEEIYFSEISGDAIGVAVGHRKVGEAYCSLEVFEKAFLHQQKYYEIAKYNNNTLEQQRALATLGRTYFIQTDCTSSQEETNRCLESSLKLFLESLELCDKLYGVVSEKEMLEMRARLYLNLGNVYDKKENSKDSLKFVSKALIIAREQKLPEDIYRCHFSLAGLYFKSNNMEKALHHVKQSLSTAKDIHSKALELDALLLLAQVFLQLSEFERAIQIFKQVYSSMSNNEEALKGLKLAILGLQLTRKYNEKESLKRNDLFSLCEKLGDFYAKFSPQHALKYYKEQLDLCLDTKDEKNHVMLASIYNSLALTYYECKQYDDAMVYYQLELKMHNSNEYNEKFDTLCMILKILELGCASFEVLKVNLDLAADCARESEKPNSAMMDVYKRFSDDILCCKTQEEYNYLKTKIERCIDEVDEESERSSDCGDGLFLNEEEKLFIEHECGGLENEEELVEKNSRSTKRKAKSKVNHINALGETPLHIAAIAGNTGRVTLLLQQGASVHARDASGWQPIHEACNHGFVDIVELLILNGADVNDPGGKHCGGTTPLHDASQNGHLNVVKLLLAHGASLQTKNTEGKTPLEVVRDLIKADKEEFRENTNDKDLYIMRIKVEEYLSQVSDVSIDWKKHRNSITVNETNESKYKQNKTLENDNIAPYKKRKLKSGLPLDLITHESPFEEVIAESSSTTSSTVSLNEDNSDLESLYSDVDPLEDISENCHEPDSPTVSNIIYKEPTKVLKKPTELPTKILKNQDNSQSFKKKTSLKAKRYRQSKISVLHTSKENLDFFDCNIIRKKSSHHNTTKPKQHHLDSFVVKSVNDVYIANKHLETQLPELRNDSLNFKQNLFRVKVHVNTTCFLIPCSNNIDENVSWLIEKVESRYRAACGIYARLALKTKDGALLNENDVIMDIIVNNEELVGEILHLDFPPLKERFLLACEDKKIAVNDELLEALTNGVSCLKLSDMLLEDNDVFVLSICLPCNLNITVLDISKTLLGDENFKILVNVLITLPNLSSLDISNVNITAVGLCYFSEHLDEKIKKEYILYNKKPPYSSLSTLLMDFNDFSDQDMFQRALRGIIKICVSLIFISFRHCLLGFNIFYPGCPLENSRLQVLRASCVSNTIVSNVLQTISTMSSLTSLDIALVSRPISESQPFKPFSKLYNMLCLPKLSELKIESLTATEIWEITTVAPSLKSLCVFNSNDMIPFVRYLSHMPYLQELDMSGCDNFDTKVLSELFIHMETNCSLVNKLTLVACSIKSPLLDNIWTTLGSIKLIYFNMDFNELTVLDKNRLRDWWLGLHGNQSQCAIVDKKCTFELF
ncbi:tonsoku-like protein isoform X2 [Hydra vulgaris]|uniref:Tonsoku-like protein isoform X2 n=1 Tax=Hydra vulgaris TaxID=6087 RepID=A0ABM4DB48_HYDVU